MTLNPTASTLPCACTDTTVCDACASRQIEALNATTADYVELLPGIAYLDECEADHWELGQESALDEKTVKRSVNYLVSQNLVSVQDTADGQLVTEVKPLQRS